MMMKRNRSGGAGGEFDRRTRRRVHPESTPIQRLFRLSTAIFRGPGTVPSPPDVETMQFFLENMKAEDFGLRTDLPFLKAKIPDGPPAIAYTTIYSCDNFSICMFFLPPTGVIPLHNHPGMTVFSKLLLGSMHIKSYDWVDTAISEDSTSSKHRLAKRVVDSDFTAPCKTSTLYPSSGGNIHTFRAITPCVVLDVLGPPYSKEEDRDCTYYRDRPHSCPQDDDVAGSGEQDRICWLEEIDTPKELSSCTVLGSADYRLVTSDNIVNNSYGTRGSIAMNVLQPFSFFLLINICNIFLFECVGRSF